MSLAIYNYQVSAGQPRVLRVFGNPDEKYTLKNLGGATVYLSEQDAANPGTANLGMDYPIDPGEAVEVPYPGLSDPRLPTLNTASGQTDGAVVRIVALS